jgi:hypothetical protein
VVVGTPSWGTEKFVGMSGEPMCTSEPAHVSTWLEPIPESVAGARRFVMDALRDVTPAVEDCELMVSELATNAVRHGRSLFRVGVYLLQGPVRVEVSDYNSRLPVEGKTGPDAQSGRGLQIVEALSQRWGVRADFEGKTVWFEVGRYEAVSGDARPNS